MMISWDIIGAISGLVIGLIMAWMTEFLEKRRILRKARLEGDDLLHKAEEAEEKLLEKTLDNLKTRQKNIRGNFDLTIGKIKEKLSELQSQTDKRAYRISLQTKEHEKILNKIKAEHRHLKEQNQILEDKIKHKNQELKKTRLELLQNLKNHFSLDTTKIKKTLSQEMLEDHFSKTNSWIEKWGKKQQQNLEKNALFHLHSVLNRFSAPYCPEKGIEKVYFASQKQMRKTIGPNRTYLNSLEAECGVDVVIHEEELFASILGIDPVRRELGRATLKKLSRIRSINEALIKSFTEKSKKELFRRIKRDGSTLCQRLRLTEIAPEVRNMMGALRYRYSFAQNQHFHCEEVGWLCGLISSEINLPFEKGRKAGLFHDIGKAMDHSIEGNHAVIGADFIEKHGEKEDIVHAVRAHHHDVTPSTALAFLVIASDAISGSRPGARRFTEDSYAKKMAQLETIADSFKNIKDAYIMNAGREMRIIVDNKNISDKEALLLSQKVAGKIERECAYPGLIKVTVVRHSEVTAVIQ